MYQIKRLFLLAALASKKAKGLPSSEIHGDQASCLKEYNLCVYSSAASTVTPCNENLIICLESLGYSNNHEEIGPVLTIQITTSYPGPGPNSDGQDEPCPEGMQWNQDILTCVDPVNTDYELPPYGQGRQPHVLFDCTIRPDGNYANPNNCAKFYSCSGGVTYSRNCQENLYYNPNSDRCDYPDNVNCQNENSVPFFDRPGN